MVAEKLILHIGQHKTGSTSLQNALQDKREQLLESGVYVPDLSRLRGNMSNLGMPLFGTSYAGVHPPSKPRDPLDVATAKADALWRSICTDVENDAPNKAIISSELFFAPSASAQLRETAQLVRQLAAETEIVAYIRAPDIFFLSFSQERLKYRRAPQVTSRTLARDTLEPYFYNWPDAVTPLIFDKTLLKGGDTKTDFFYRFLPEVDAASVLDDFRQHNASMSAEAMAVLHDVVIGNIVWSGPQWLLYQEINRADRKFPKPTKPKLKDAVAETLLNWRADDLFWLRDYCGLTFPTVDYAALNRKEVRGPVFRSLVKSRA